MFCPSYVRVIITLRQLRIDKEGYPLKIITTVHTSRYVSSNGDVSWCCMGFGWDMWKQSMIQARRLDRAITDFLLEHSLKRQLELAKCIGVTERIGTVVQYLYNLLLSRHTTVRFRN